MSTKVQINKCLRIHDYKCEKQEKCKKIRVKEYHRTQVEKLMSTRVPKYAIYMSTSTKVQK